MHRRSTDRLERSEAEPVTVVVQDAKRLFREGLAMFLAAEPGVEVAGTAETHADLASLCELHAPSVVVIDADGDADELRRVLGAVRRHRQSSTVIGLIDAVHQAGAAGARRAGVKHLLTREAGINPILAAVCGDIVELPATAPKPTPVETRRPSHPPLTARELEVLELVSTGRTSREISAHLGISAKTVENHKQRSFQKLGVQNQAHAVARAMREGLLTPRELRIPAGG